MSNDASEAGIRRRLSATGLSQAKIGEWLGLGQPAISRRMSGKIPWRAHECMTLADRLGIPVGELVAEIYDVDKQAS